MALKAKVGPLVAIAVVVAAIVGVQVVMNRGGEGEGGSVEPGSGALPVLMELGSATCEPCKEMAPILKELASQYRGQIEVKSVDVYAEPEVSERYEVEVIPTQILLDEEGKEVFRHRGFYPKAEIVAKFEELGWTKRGRG